MQEHLQDDIIILNNIPQHRAWRVSGRLCTRKSWSDPSLTCLEKYQSTGRGCRATVRLEEHRHPANVQVCMLLAGLSSPNWNLAADRLRGPDHSSTPKQPVLRNTDIRIAKGSPKRADTWQLKRGVALLLRRQTANGRLGTGDVDFDFWDLRLGLLQNIRAAQRRGLSTDWTLRQRANVGGV